LFHHIHHDDNEHRIHHCGGDHEKINPELSYEISHCACGKHKINKENVVGHTINEHLELVKIKIRFIEKCPESGWHIESGIKEI